MTQITLKLWNRTAVRCEVSYRANERPLSFLLDETEIEVRTILESWREPDYLYFKVETQDGRVYDLRHREFEDSWQVRESGQGLPETLLFIMSEVIHEATLSPTLKCSYSGSRQDWGMVQPGRLRPHRSLNYRPPAPEATITTWILHITRGDLFPIPGSQGTISLAQQVVLNLGEGQPKSKCLS